MVLQEDAETETFHRHQALPLMVLRPRNGGQVVPNKPQTKLGSILKHDQKSKAFIQEFYNNYYVPKYIRVHYIHSVKNSRIYSLAQCFLQKYREIKLFLKFYSNSCFHEIFRVKVNFSFFHTVISISLTVSLEFFIETFKGQAHHRIFKHVFHICFIGQTSCKRT